MKKSRRYLLFISLMFGILFSLGNPAIPSYTASLSIRESMVGFYLASNGIGLFVFATIWGAIGDIKDRNKVLGIIFIGVAVGQILFGTFKNEYLLLLATLITGIFSAGVLVNIYSYINDTFKVDIEKNKMLSYAVSLYLLGGAIAYILGGELAVLLSPRLNLIFIIQGSLVFLFALYIFFEKTDLVDVDHHLSRRHFWITTKQIFKLPWVPIYTITLTFFISFSHNNVRRFIDYYIIDKDYNAIDLGALVFVVGVIGLLANLLIAPYFLKRYHNFAFLTVQFLIAPIFLFLTFYTTNTLLGMYTFYIGYSIMLAVYEPTAISFISENKEVSQGVLVGVRQSIVGLGMTIGFIVGGFLYEKNNLYVFYLSIAFYILVFIGFVIITIIKRKDVVKYRKNYLKEEKS